MLVLAHFSLPSFINFMVKNFAKKIFLDKSEVRSGQA